jgi:hypothetical protein
MSNDTPYMREFYQIIKFEDKYSIAEANVNSMKELIEILKIIPVPNLNLKINNEKFNFKDID